MTARRHVLKHSGTWKQARVQGSNLLGERLAGRRILHQGAEQTPEEKVECCAVRGEAVRRRESKGGDSDWGEGSVKRAKDEGPKEGSSSQDACGLPLPQERTGGVRILRGGVTWLSGRKKILADNNGVTPIQS